MEHSKRIYSLDVFRGATIAAMILVNNAGSYDYVYPQLLHAEWHGWTFTDWIFPFFLFMVGMSMVFSFESRLKHGDTHQQILRHSLKRLLILFALGLFINGFPFGLIPGSQFSIATWRILGVLQRIGICYFFTSLIYLNVKPKGQWLWIGILLGIYWFALKVIPVPGYGAGVLEPEGNLAWFIDKTLLGKHTWAFAPVFGFDPEGILSTIPAIASTLLGVQAGRWLRSERSQEEKTAGMFVAGNLCLLLGIIMNIWLPINKNLWTSSYVVFINGWALNCFATIYWIVDVKGKTWGTKPFVIFGMNAITVYTLSELLANLLWAISWNRADGTFTTLHDAIYENVFLPIASPVNASLLFAIAFVLMMYAVAWGMWKKRLFIKI